MKKTLSFLFFAGIFLSPKLLCGDMLETEDEGFTAAVSAGYVFKHDCAFKSVYGRGMINIITVDGCYYPWQFWGIGAKVSYWRAKGRTTFLQRCSLLQEVPITFYLRTVKDFTSDLQAYLSLGAGGIWMKEQSYLGKVRLNKAIGEVEVGLNCLVWHCLNVTGAFRYLFPPQSVRCAKVDVGGCDLRAGIGFEF